MRCLLVAWLVAMAMVASTSEDVSSRVGWFLSDNPQRSGVQHQGRELSQNSWIVDGRSCTGMETDWNACPSLPACDECTAATAINCSFTAWSSWSEPSNCFGLCRRSRSIAQSNNECGKPCNGTLEETKQCPSVGGCSITEQSCLLGVWMPWSTCTNSFAQQKRRRMVTVEAVWAGEACNSILEETRPCAPQPNVSCNFVSWEDWTQCDKQCGGGFRTRIRQYGRSQGVGSACAGRTWEESICNNQTCGVQIACHVSDWGAWSGCSAAHPMQRFRERVSSNAINGGAACSATLRETKGCSYEPQNCVISSWTTWTACTVTCNGGHMSRTRTQSSAPKYGGTCTRVNTSEVHPCGQTSCYPPALACQLTSWSPWSACSSTCGTGNRERTRTSIDAQPSGEGCRATLTEVRECLGNVTVCEKIECKLSNWDNWGVCSASCDGGSQPRYRKISVNPSHGLKCPNHTQAELRQCNMQSCVPCVDGTWATWGLWSLCSATCGSAFRKRVRAHANLPNVCGKPALGSNKQYQRCAMSLPCQTFVNCSLSAWDSWSVCSSSCVGMQSRKRHIVTSASREGKSCENTVLEQLAPCFKGTPNQRIISCQGMNPDSPCKLSDWQAWSQCSATCGIGVRERRRSIVDPAIGNGTACAGAQIEADSCSYPCPTAGLAKHCLFSAWSSWGGCTRMQWPHLAQKERSRVITQRPNEYGRQCQQHAALTQTTNCWSDDWNITLTRCTWAPWSAFSTCPTKCNGTRFRSRRQIPLSTGVPLSSTLSKGMFYDTVFDGLCQAPPQNETIASCAPCVPPSCVPHDLAMSSWSDWTSDMTNKLCKRRRAKTKDKNKCGRYIGLGTTGQTKNCAVGNATACHFGAFAQGSACSNYTSQIYSERTKSANFPSNCKGFVADSDILIATTGCLKQFKPKKNCSMSPWTMWSACSTPTLPCNGMSERHRSVRAASMGGNDCIGSNKETRECINCRHNVTCAFADWSTVSVKCETTNKKTCHGERSRSIGPVAGVWTMNACIGAMQEVFPAEICHVSSWTDWSACSKTCNGGQMTRSRNPTYPNPDYKSLCPHVNVQETVPCNAVVVCPGDAMPPPVNCMLSDWGMWSMCSRTCDYGTEKRTRVISVHRNIAGVGCEDSLRQTRICGGSPCVPAFPCIGSGWSDWSVCTKSCKGGQMIRSRNISQAPTGGGLACRAGTVKSEVAPCNTGICPGECQDAEWGEWMPISTCSSTCMGGLIHRKRPLKVHQFGCGTTAVGLREDLFPCNSNVPCYQNSSCRFEAWSTWSACVPRFPNLDPCSGASVRFRAFVGAKNSGAPCDGSLEQTRSCRNATNRTCLVPTPPACTFAAWSAWSVCSQTCGGGQMLRQRNYSHHSIPCNGATREVVPCATKRCMGPSGDCHYSQWSAWSACHSCGGQRNRMRQIINYNKPGGKLCDKLRLEETGSCTRQCANMYCSWRDWRAWSECSTTCGTGKRSRTRIMGLVQAPTVMTKLDKDNIHEDRVHELYRKARTAQAQRSRELVLAFSLGGTAIISIAALGMISNRYNHRNQSRNLRILVDL